GRSRMTGRLAGKVAIVTGAGSRGPGIGNGKATAILFAREGARVLCVDQEESRAEETVRLIRAEGGEAGAQTAQGTGGADRGAVGWWRRRWHGSAASTSCTTTSGSSRGRISSRPPRRSGTRSSRST